MKAAFGTVPAGLKLETSALEDYKLVHELFTRMLLPADANKLLVELHGAIRKGTVECFI